MDSDVLIVTSVMTALALVLVAFFYFRARARQELHITLRAAIEKGEALTPEVIENMTHSKNADLRRGMIAIAIGISTASFGLLIGEEEALRPMLGISVFPTLIGVAYILLWVRNSRD